MNEVAKAPGPHPIGTLSRGLHLMECVAQLGGNVRLTELSLKAGLDKGTTHRLSTKLIELGYLDRDGLGRMSIGLRVLNLAFAHLASLDLRTVALPELADLVNELDCSISLCVLDGTEIVYLERVLSKRLQPTLPVGVGARMPSYCTAGGKSILAHLPPPVQEDTLTRIVYHPFTSRTHRDRESLRADLNAIVERGFAIADQEQLEGYIAAAAPVFDHQGACIACVSAGAFNSQKSMAEMRGTIAPSVAKAAQRISARLGQR
jgi:DNA-binding IclR family transcriptional regulator